MSNKNKKTVEVPITEGPPPPQEETPKYTLFWKASLNDNGEEVGVYEGAITMSTLKLSQRATIMVGEALFQKMVEDTNV